MKPITKKLLVVGVFVAAAIAWAAPPPSYDLFRWIKGRLNVGSTYVEGNGITHTGAGCISYDFPAIGGASTSLLPLCATTTAITVTGARFRDSCEPSSALGEDGGTALDTAVDVTCTVTAANAATVKACAHMSDGGAIDMPVSTWCARTFSFR